MYCINCPLFSDMDLQYPISTNEKNISWVCQYLKGTQYSIYNTMLLIYFVQYNKYYIIIYYNIVPCNYLLRFCLIQRVVRVVLYYFYNVINM